MGLTSGSISSSSGRFTINNDGGVTIQSYSIGAVIIDLWSGPIIPSSSLTSPLILQGVPH